VFAGDVAIASAAIYGVIRSGTGQNATQIVAILTSAFTAIGTMTTAYFGIRAASNTAQAATADAADAVVAQATGRPNGEPKTPGGGGGTTPETGGGTTPETGGGTTPETGGGTTPETGGGTTEVQVGTGGVAETKVDRPTEEPENATQEDQYDLIRETGNERQGMTEVEEAHLLEDMYGQPRNDLYAAPTEPSGEEKEEER
jgi:hypothetical protein